jgi:hypothetical protein
MTLFLGREQRLLRSQRLPHRVRPASPGGHVQRPRQSLHVQSGIQVLILKAIVIRQTERFRFKL